MRRYIYLIYRDRQSQILDDRRLHPQFQFVPIGSSCPRAAKSAMNDGLSTESILSSVGGPFSRTIAFGCHRSIACRLGRPAGRAILPPARPYSLTRRRSRRLHPRVRRPVPSPLSGTYLKSKDRRNEEHASSGRTNRLCRDCGISHRLQRYQTGNLSRGRGDPSRQTGSPMTSGLPSVQSGLVRLIGKPGEPLTLSRRPVPLPEFRE